METPFKHAWVAYGEIIKSGEIRVNAEGEYIALKLKGNICGDILVFIGPRFKTNPGIAEIGELINSDSKLANQSKIAFDSLKMKLNGLTLLPKSIVWMVNIVVSSLFLNTYSEKIFETFRQNDFGEALFHALPVVVFTLVTIFYGKSIGFKLVIPIISAITRISRLVRRIRNNNVEG